jgi:endonuclease/exonuclease/phosphatase family metal-dependent hydrolase
MFTGRLGAAWRPALGVCLFVAVVCGRAQAADEVKVGTFNCEFLIKDKVHVKFGLPLETNKWTPAQKAEWTPAHRDAQFGKAVKAVAQVIKAMGADVVALCEVGDEADVEALRLAVGVEGLDYPHKAVCKSADTATGQHVAVLSKRPLTLVLKALPGRKAFDKELDEAEEEGDTGVSKGMLVTFEAGGKPVNLVVAHLASERLGHEQDAQRLAQASIVRRVVLPLLEKGEHVIVAGDFNAHRGTPALRRLMGRDDIGEDLLQTAGPVAFPRKNGESNDDYNKRIGGHWTYEFAGQRKQIDHILISRTLKPAGGGGIKTTFFDVEATIEGAGKASDHRPLVVLITLP